jgi:hypothetical protein
MQISAKSLIRTSRKCCPLALAALVVAGCGSQPAAQLGDGTLQATVRLAETQADVTEITVRVVAGGGSCADEPIVEQNLAVEQVPLPDELAAPGAGDEHRFSSGLFVLPAGSYHLCATPLMDDGRPSSACSSAEADLTVVAGTTSDLVLVAQCDGDASGAAGVIALLNTAPSISDLQLSPGRFIQTNQQVSIEVSASDPDGDAISYHWAVSSAPAGAQADLTGSGAQATFRTATAGSYEVEVTVTDAYEGQSSIALPINVEPDPVPVSLSWKNVAVTNDGRAVVVGNTSDKIYARCYTAEGDPGRGVLVYDNEGRRHSVSVPKVARAGVSGHFAVLSRVFTVDRDYSSRRYMVRIYDRDCIPTTSAWLLPGEYEYADLALDNQGNLAVVRIAYEREAYRRYVELNMYRSDGTPIIEAVDVGTCSYGSHVAFNPTTGDGVVSCQEHYYGSVFYRRFRSDGSLVGDGLVTVAPSTGRNSWYNTHTVGMNHRGEFVVLWQNYNESSREAAFFSADEELLAHVTVGSDRRHETDWRITALVDGDFILPDSGEGGSYSRYGADGTLVGQAAPGLNVDRLAIDASDNTYLVDSGRLQIAPFELVH